MGMKILIAGFNTNLFCSALICVILILKCYGNALFHSCICSDVSILNELDTILCYHGLKQHITAEFSAVKRNASVSDAPCFILLSSASGLSHY